MCSIDEIKISGPSKIERNDTIFKQRIFLRVFSVTCRHTGNREMSNRTGENGAEVTKGDGERKREGDTSLHIFLCHSGRGDALLSRDKSKCGGKIAGKRRGAGFRGVWDECRRVEKSERRDEKIRKKREGKIARRRE